MADVHRMNSTFRNLVIVHITPQRILKASQQDGNEYCGTLVSLQRLPSVYIGTLYFKSFKGKLKTTRGTFERPQRPSTIYYMHFCVR